MNYDNIVKRTLSRSIINECKIAKVFIIQNIMEEIETTEVQDDILSNIHTHNKDYIFVTFWASWCHFCVEELPVIQRLFETFNDKIDFAIVNCGEDKDYIYTFLKDRGYSFPVVYDTNGILTSYYNVKGIPRTLILNKDNSIYKDLVGSKSFEEWKSIIAAL